MPNPRKDLVTIKSAFGSPDSEHLAILAGHKVLCSVPAHNPPHVEKALPNIRQSREDACQEIGSTTSKEVVEWGRQPTAD